MTPQEAARIARIAGEVFTLDMTAKPINVDPVSWARMETVRAICKAFTDRPDTDDIQTQVARALTPFIPSVASKPNPLLIMADALECFWNASIGSAKQSQDATALAVAGALSEGFAAVASRLRDSQS